MAETNSRMSTVVTSRRVMEIDRFMTQPRCKDDTLDDVVFRSAAPRLRHSASFVDLKRAPQSRWNDVPNRSRKDAPEVPASKRWLVADEEDIPGCGTRS